MSANFIRADKIQFRVMTIADYEKVYELWMSCKNMGFNNLDDSKEGIEKFLKRNPNTSYVAEEADRIIGVVLAGHDGRRGYIYHMSVAEDYRKQGIAGKLLENSLSVLKAEGINKVALLVFNRNEIGNAFWESQGFTVRDDVAYRNKALTEIIRIDT
ncbi:MAG: GNAT family N-acetyltransferase [Lachnospiraceae bacterium]|nr:GNAT family N-acetyltransferase [Lachnospiraceae bacterium]